MTGLGDRAADFYQLRQYLRELGEDNSRSHNTLLRNLYAALREEITPGQWEDIVQYYVELRSMPEIARARGVTVSTVSRSIHRGLRRLRKCLRYGAKELLREELEGE